ncbi:hypothetical protein AB9K35_09555, partial [Leisingera sp. XS_AS12]
VGKPNLSRRTTMAAKRLARASLRYAKAQLSPRYRRKLHQPLGHCSAKAQGGKIALTLCPTHGGNAETRSYDLVVLATGYQRRIGETLLSGLNDYVSDREAGRTYQLATTENFHPRIFLQGYCEETHGLSDTLLSVLAVRVDEIANELLAPRQVTEARLTAAE